MTSQMRRYVNERWKQWYPRLLAQARKDFAPCSASQLEVWRLTHIRRVTILLERSVRLRKIKHWNWDDPRLGEQEFGIILDKAITNTKKRNKTVPPRGLAKFSRKHHNRTDTGGTA